MRLAHHLDKQPLHIQMQPTYELCPRKKNHKADNGMRPCHRLNKQLRTTSCKAMQLKNKQS